MQYNYGIPGQNMAMPDVSIKRLLLIPTKERYQDVFQRSFQLGGNYNTLNKLTNVLEQAGVAKNTQVSEGYLAKNIPEIISINSTPIGVANIPNGWGTQRLRFMMEVECRSASTLSVYLQGYSEYHDPTLTKLVDPNMKFFINSITVVIKQFDPISGTYIVRPMSTFNVITDFTNQQRFTEVDDGGMLSLLRPSDVINQLHVLETYGFENNNNVANATGRISSNSVHTSNRANNSPISHFASTINSIVNAKSLGYESGNMQDVYRIAAQNTVESKIMTIPFIMALHVVTGKPIPSDFTLNVLNTIDPSINSNNKITLIDNVNDIVLPSYNTMLDSSHTESTLQATAESVKAVNLAQAMSSILTECMLVTMDVSITNMSGMPIVVTTNAQTFIEGVDPLLYINKARAKIEHEVIPKLTDSGYTLVEVHVHCNILGDTNIAISLNSNPSILFRFPTFADSLYIPVIADTVTKASLTDSYCNIIDAVNLMSSPSTNPSTGNYY